MQAELEQCYIKISRSGELEEENESLRQELATLRACLPDAAGNLLAQSIDKQIETPRHGDRAGSVHLGKARSTDSDFTQADHTALVAKFNRLSKRFQETTSAHGRLIAKYRKDKETIRAWIAYYQQHRPESAGSLLAPRLGHRVNKTGLKEPESREIYGSITLSRSTEHTFAVNPDVPDHIAEGAATNGRFPASDMGLENAHTAGAGPPDTLRDPAMTSSPDHTSLNLDSPCLNNLQISIERGMDSPTALDSGKQSPPDTRNVKVEASATDIAEDFHSPESTQDETKFMDNGGGAQVQKKSQMDGPTGVVTEPESDLPVLVSERVLKRKRRNRPDSIVQGLHRHQYGTNKDPIKVKSEPSSSSPIGMTTYHEILNESLDLDEVGRAVRTPRKRARLQDFTVLRERCDSSKLAIDNDRQSQDSESLEFETPEGHSNHEASVEDEFEAGEEYQILSLLHKNIFTHDRPESRPRTSGSLGSKIDKAKVVTMDDSINATHVTPEQRMPSNGQLVTPQSITKSSARSLEREAQHLRATSAPPDAGISQSSVLPDSTADSSKARKILQPTSNNVKVLPRFGDKRSTLQRSRYKKGKSGIAQITYLAEDGEAVPYATPRLSSPCSALKSDTFTTAPTHLTNNKVKIYQRLTNLLEEPSPSRYALKPGDAEHEVLNRHIIPTPRHSQVNLGRHELDEVEIVDHKLPWARASCGRPNPEHQNHRGSPTGASSTARSPPPLPLNISAKAKAIAKKSPEPKSLRAVPLHLLGLEDFRINPGYNQGLNYAFTEPIRDHDRRKCLPGCTRPECCGNTFRKSIQLGGMPTAQTSGLRWNSSPPENEEDELLERFFGDDKDSLRKATEDERQELLLQARTKLFANKHGKHRQAYERRSTPPGFWRTDMPTTQEVEADHEEAKERERTKVEERYREAMRPGGRWIFRDE